jgi:hypothetical protein
MFIPVATLMTLILFAFMLGMLASFFLVLNLLLRVKK